MITLTQELLRAEKHINNGDYETARKILSSLNDPTAREWLKSWIKSRLLSRTQVL